MKTLFLSPQLPQVFPPLSGIAARKSAIFEFGDVDNDHDQDLLISGTNTSLYINDGQGNFSEFPILSIEKSEPDCFVVEDLNMDGYMDILETGISGGIEYLYRCYLQAPNYNFVHYDFKNIEGLEYNNIVFGDIDGDSDRDLLALGNANHHYLTHIYRNNSCFPFYENFDSLEVCANTIHTFPDGVTDTITSDTIHINRFQTIKGCDSTLITYVFIKPIYKVFDTLNVCDGSIVSFPDGAEFQVFSDTTYTSHLLSSLGCDSIIHTTIRRTVINNDINYSLGVLTAFDSISSYQWLDCSNNFEEIIDEKERYFQPIAEGSYAVEITKNSCIDTSECRSVVLSNLVNMDSKHTNEDLSIYPNPAKNGINIKSNSGVNISDIWIFDINGIAIYETHNVSHNFKHLDISNYGHAFFIKVKFDNNVHETFRIIRLE